MGVTAGKRGGIGGVGGGVAITHMLHSIFPSFVRWTMRARGPVLKKDRHTVTTSNNPGETPAKPEVSEKNPTWTCSNSVFTVFSGRRYFVAGLKGKLITCFWRSTGATK